MNSKKNQKVKNYKGFENRKEADKNQSKKISKVGQLLLDAFGTIDDIDFFLAHGRQYMGYGRSIGEMRELKSALDKREKSQALFQAKRRKLLKVQKEGERMMACLTSNGAIELLRAKIKIENKLLPEGQICFVIFDIPEDVRYLRDAFRNLLKEIGFRMTQRSVWEGELDIIDDIRSLVEVMKAGKYIRIYHALDIR